MQYKKIYQPFHFKDFLPQKLRVEIGVNVHLAALKRVPIFAEAQPGFLIELVTRLKLQIFSPGEYVCKKGMHSHFDLFSLIQ